MGFFLQKNFRDRSFWSRVTFPVLLATLFVACGEDTVNNSDQFSKDNPELSSADDSEVSSSSVASGSKRSSSSSKTSVTDSLSSQSDEDLVNDSLLDVAYVLVD